MKKGKRKMYAEGTKIYGKNESFIHEHGRGEKKFELVLQNPKATANV